MIISVIIPVFNAEATLPDTLRSIAGQSFRDFEVIFIDDASTDGSPAVMEQFAVESGFPVQIIRQMENRGVAAARNCGLDAANGDWLAFVDADDTLEPTALETAISAISTEVDIIGWDWTLGFEKNGRYMRQADYTTPLQALQNLMGGTMRWNLWLFLLRRELIEENNIRFIDGANMAEDMQFMIKSFCAANHTIQVHEALYRYNALSNSSISRQFSDERRAEISTNLEEATSAVIRSPYAETLAPFIQYLKLFLKLPLLIGSDRNNYQLWYNWFPESNDFATSNKALPLRTRLLQGMAARRLWWGVRLYYYLIYKFVYGFLFR